MRIKLIEDIENLIEYYNQDTPNFPTQATHQAPTPREVYYAKNNEILAILSNILKALDPNKKNVLD